MAFTSYQIFLAFGMLLSGSCNTIVIKGVYNLQFEHPFVQSWFMFLGEILCLVTFKILLCSYSNRSAPKPIASLMEGNRNVSPFYMFAPAMFDMCGTSAMYVGLTLTFSSTFQMLRGSIIIFVALLSIVFLGRRLVSREWLGIFVLFLGLLTVGFSDYREAKLKEEAKEQVKVEKEHPMEHMIMGDIIIVLAQIIIALQMVYEEKYVSKLNIPALQAVGWEGIFGLLAMTVLIGPIHFIRIPWDDDKPMEDVPAALNQMATDWRIIALVILSIFSIAFFNYSGLSVTKEISATTRMVLDSLRTVIIWVFEMCMGWKSFQFLQLVGFILLLFGTCLYNNLFVPKWCQSKDDGPNPSRDRQSHYQARVGLDTIDTSEPILQERHL